MSDGTIDIRIGAQGWKPAVAGHRQKGKGVTKRVQKAPAHDPSGLYVNRWYYDGQSHRAGVWVAVCIPLVEAG